MLNIKLATYTSIIESTQYHLSDKIGILRVRKRKYIKIVSRIEGTPMRIRVTISTPQLLETTLSLPK